MNASTIVLNGKRYDAITGKFLGEVKGAQQTAPAVKAIDGFVRAAPQRGHAMPVARRPVVQTAAASQTMPANTAPNGALSIAVRRAAPHHIPAHQPQKARTLMRTGVHRPAAGFKRQTKVAVHTGALVRQPHFDIVPKASISTVDEDRLKRAKRVEKRWWRISVLWPDLCPQPSVLWQKVSENSTKGFRGDVSAIGEAQ